MRYLYISYNPDKTLRDTKWYETLEEVKSERGITSNEEVLERTRVSSYSSSDKSGCFLLDFNNKSIDDIDTTHASIIMPLMISVRRELLLKELGI